MGIISEQHSPKLLKLFPRLVIILLLALVYYATAEISRHVASTPQSVTPVWPPDGFAAAAVLIFGYQVLPGVLIGSFLANIWAFFNPETIGTTIISILQVLGIAFGTTTGIGVGNYLLQRVTHYRNPFTDLKYVYKFIIFIVFFTPIINATTGVLSLCLGGSLPWAMFAHVWLIWWISNVSGICVFTPLILSWRKFLSELDLFSKIFLKRQILQIRKNQKKFIFKSIEALFLLAVVIIFIYISFYEKYNLEYVLIPCLVWVVIRFGQFEATNLIGLITTIAVIRTVQNLGTFATKNNNNSLIYLQSFILVIVLTNLILMAILAEKNHTFISLKKSEKRLFDKTQQLEKSQLNLSEVAQILERQNKELIEAKEIAEYANQTKTKFLSNMSHELRTPLNAILGLVQLLQNSNNLDAHEQSDLMTIYQSGSYLLNLIEDILDISKIEAGKMELYPQEVNIQEFLSNLVEIIQVQAKAKKIDFMLDFATDLPQFVSVDRKRLGQVLLNLLNNAVKFTESGHVIFRVYQNQPEFAKIANLSETNDNENNNNNAHKNSIVHFYFAVKDSGIGISETKLNSIFLPFEQTGTTEFKVQGTGLGLAISQEIVKMMGGKITVESQQNQGSTFSFTIPLRVINHEKLNQNNQPSPIQPSVFDGELAKILPLKILLAEDNVVNQKVASKILVRLGYLVDIASNGLDVLTALDSQQYDVILMDVQMPEMDGIETTKRVLGMDGDRPYIIALTANAMESDRLTCLAAGMNDYISKPINVKLLIEALWRSQNSQSNLE